MTEHSERLPLSGITVVSLEQAVAAPFATRQLADLGARVIKVERPGGGDFARRYDTTVHGQSSYFVWLNRSKESMTLDLKSNAGRTILERLLGRADVFVQNLAPGAVGRMGLGTEALAERFPSLIPCSISGYGADGPWADRKAYDLLVQCQTGLVSLTGNEHGSARVGVSIADIAAGMYAYSGILTALFTRATTGIARAVEVSLFEALAEWVSQPAYYTRHGGTQPPRIGTQHATIAPYGAYACADGKEVLFTVQNEREWTALCELLERPGLIEDERFATTSDRVAHRTELNEIVAARLGELDSGTAMDLLDRAGLANAGVNDIEEFLAHPVLGARGRWRNVRIPGGSTVPALLPPVDLAGMAPRMDVVPAAGEHTSGILAELGYSAADIDSLSTEHAIERPEAATASTAPHEERQA
ncbi:CaiB/BaiF CoA transferase family protein [Streptomyces iranensis]|uniref:Formyl-CoA transferase n=1 Tax=Streptomyces iranensis TaxID=576784 RepID=A0A061A0J0_9ACTN|nr:CaiB/BaiF CoA-transferase family protein [Streptomyces iranensis]MBP2060183.1 formyl-CoA transferase [Streptomyces iranensis]CDR13707.1 L-carnitine dehydratase/bile acid-inducibleprotein F [Streptomyces iranensis]